MAYSYYESDIEEAFVEQAPRQFGYQIIGRQISLPVGYADIVMFDCQLGPRNPLQRLMVAEIKRGNAPDSAIAQAVGYAASLEDYLQFTFLEPTCGISHFDWQAFFGVRTLIIAKSLGSMGKKALKADAIDFVSYQLKNGEFTFRKEHIRNNDSNYDNRFRGAVHEWFKRSYATILMDPSNINTWCLERQPPDLSTYDGYKSGKLEDAFNCPELWRRKQRAGNE